MRESAALFERHSSLDDRAQKTGVEKRFSNSLVDTAPHPWYDEGGFDQSYAMDGFRGARIISSAAEGRLPRKRRERDTRRKPGTEPSRRAWSLAEEVCDCQGLAARWRADLSGGREARLCQSAHRRQVRLG